MRKVIRVLVKDLFPLVDGLFSHIDFTFWDFTAGELDIQLLSRCGFRRVAPIVRIIRGDVPLNQKLTQPQLEQLGTMLLKAYGPKWLRLSQLNSLEYDILKNYVDEYHEVLKDDDSTEESKVANKADRAFDSTKLASATGSNSTQNASNTNESESTRLDNFLSEFSRSSSDSTTRTDNLTESKIEAEDSDSTRTDNLTDARTFTETGSNTHQGGDYAEGVSRQLTRSGTQSGSSGIYGFDSSVSVPDSDSSNITSDTESETISKTFTGAKSDAISKGGTDSIDHTGSQRNVSGIDKSSTKNNSGTQSIAESISVSDTTNNTDNQTNTTTSEGTSNTSNESRQNAVSNSDTQRGSASQLDESAIISRALNRVRSYSHKGNIGNFTPQQLIKQEIELWRWNFIDEVLNDVKDFISIPIYY